MTKIKEFRAKYGLTQKQLGILLGYSKDQIYRLEADNRHNRKMKPYFLTALDNLEQLLKSGHVKIDDDLYKIAEEKACNILYNQKEYVADFFFIIYR
jgi:transcriptional regulator with XRE-family HTH domain